MTANYTNYYV